MDTHIGTGSGHRDGLAATPAAGEAKGSSPRGRDAHAPRDGNAVHLTDALRILRDGAEHDIECWKLSTGDLLRYRRAVAIGGYTLGATTRLRLLDSGALRSMRHIALISIDGLSVYL